MYHKSADEKKQLMKLFGEIYDNPMWSLGQVTKKAEEMCKSKIFLGEKEALLVNDGTHALELCLRDINVKGKDVIIPAMTVPMVAWAVERAGGNPILCDVSPHHLQMEVDALAEAYDKAEDVAAVIIVHTGGLISPDIFDIVTFCKERSLPLVEDISHAQTSCIIRKHEGLVQPDVGYAGQFGDYASFSMYATKVVSVGEGGFAAKRGDITGMKALRNQGKTDNQKFVREGYNFRASEWTAAVAYVKLDNLAHELWHRKRIALVYDNAGVQSAHKSYVYSSRNMEMHPSFYKYIVINNTVSIHNAPHQTGAVHRDIPLYGSHNANRASREHICLSLTNEEHAEINIEFLKFHNYC